MVSWSSLPSEIKQHVVEKLDFMSRHSLRQSSDPDKKVVDSTKFTVECVRIGYKEGKGLLAIYTGIDKFVRFELERKKEGILVTKSENSHDPSQACQPVIIKISQEALTIPMYLAMLFHFFLQEQCIHIKRLDYDIPDIPNSNPDKIPIRKSAWTTAMITKGRVDRVWFSGMPDAMVLHDITRANEKGPFQIRRLIIYEESMFPVVAQDELVPTAGLPITHTLFTNDRVRDSNRFAEEIRQIFVERMKSQKTNVMSTLRNVNDRKPQKSIRTRDKGFVHYSKTTECGNLVRTVRVADEEDFKEDLEKIVEKKKGKTPEIQPSWGFGKHDKCLEKLVLGRISISFDENIPYEAIGQRMFETPVELY
uniref:F-box domain-containing protein n=1 Tax=Caenorhabditis tropicalis TaxID=1561998 RepID=A0A1I7UE98_9PELO